MPLLFGGHYHPTQCFQVTFPDSMIACWRPQYLVLFLISIRFWFVDYIDIILKAFEFFQPSHSIISDLRDGITTFEDWERA